MTRSPAAHATARTRFAGRARIRRSLVGSIVSLLLIVAAASPAAATWSIIALDPETGEVGAAMAACSPASALGEADEVPVPLILVPGRGVAAAQGSIDPPDIDQLRSVLMDPTVQDADTVIATVVADNNPELQAGRQYAVVTGVSVASAGGESPVSARARGTAMAAQGVALSSADVVEEALSAYSAARDKGAGLDTALVEALLAGSLAGGDRRCGEQTALFAHVSVASPGEDGVAPDRLLTVTVDEGDGQNPVVLLADAHSEGETGWVDAGRRPPTTVPRWIVLVAGLTMAAAAVAVIRRGLGYRRPATG